MYKTYKYLTPEEHNHLTPEEQWLEMKYVRTRSILIFYILSVTLFSMVILLALLIDAATVHAQEITDAQGIRCVIGEASNQGQIGMEAVADAIQNRALIIKKPLNGIYGCKSPHIDKEPKWVWEMARKAWERAKTGNISMGATHWENINAFGKPQWAYKLKEVYRYKDHVFYK